MQNFIPIQQAVRKFRFALFHNIFYEINMPYLCKLWNYIPLPALELQRLSSMSSFSKVYHNIFQTKIKQLIPWHK